MGAGAALLGIPPLMSARALAYRMLSLCCPPGGKLQKPQSEPGGLPGKHKAAPHHGGLQVEHKTDCSLGPGQCGAPGLAGKLGWAFSEEGAELMYSVFPSGGEGQGGGV